MEDTLIELLESLGYGVYRQGSLGKDEEYPATFLTFWENDENDENFYSNAPARTTYNFDVNVYSNNPALTYSLLSRARELLKQHGWIITTRGYDVASDEITHIGRGMNVTFLEY